MAENEITNSKIKKFDNPERLKEIPTSFILEKAKLNEPELMIDYGAGTGIFSKEVYQAYPKSKIMACDISEKMIEWMQTHVAIEYPENIIPILMQDNRIPLEDGIADFLFMLNLHHELPNPIKALNEASRLLKPQGVIAICDWKKEEVGKGPSFDERVTISEVEKHLREANFKEIEVYDDMKMHFLFIARKQ